MNGTCDEFFTCAGLTPDQNRSRRPRDSTDELENVLNGAARADDRFNAEVLVHLLAQSLNLYFHSPALERSFDDDFHFFELEWLYEIVVGAAGNGLHDRFLRSESRGHDDDDRR